MPNFDSNQSFTKDRRVLQAYDYGPNVVWVSNQREENWILLLIAIEEKVLNFQIWPISAAESPLELPKLLF